MRCCWATVTALIGVFGMILWLILNSLDVGPRLVGLASTLPHPSSLAITAETALLLTIVAAGCLALVVAAIWLVGVTKRLTHHSVWSHEHFSGAMLAQFFYVAAQAGIFSFLINYMTSEPPSLPASWLKAGQSTWVSCRKLRTTFAGSDFKDVPSLAAKLSAPADPLSAFLASKLSDSTQETLAQYKTGAASETAARVAIDAGPEQPRSAKQEPLQPGTIQRSRAAGQDETTAGAGRQEPKRAAAQPAVAGRCVSEGTDLSRRRRGRHQPVRGQSGDRSASSASSWAG